LLSFISVYKERVSIHLTIQPVHVILSQPVIRPTSTVQLSFLLDLWCIQCTMSEWPSSGETYSL